MNDADANALCTLLQEVRDELKDELSCLKIMVREAIVRCEPCYKSVMGNGKASLDARLTALETQEPAADVGQVAERVTKLEERDQTRVRILGTAIAMAGLVAGLVSGAVAVVRWLTST